MVSAEYNVHVLDRELDRNPEPKFEPKYEIPKLNPHHQPLNHSVGEPKKTFNNYFSIGVDASAASRFHNLRNRRPDLFPSRFLNKVQR